MKWVIRERPKTDRICASLIRKFVDPDAEFPYLADQVLAVAEREGVHACCRNEVDSTGGS